MNTIILKWTLWGTEKSLGNKYVWMHIIDIIVFTFMKTPLLLTLKVNILLGAFFFSVSKSHLYKFKYSICFNYNLKTK